MTWWALWREAIGLLPPVQSWPPPPSSYGEAVLAVAIAELGKGEQGGNNIGPDLDRYRQGGPGGAWCAAFVAYCLEVGAVHRKMECPVRRSHNAKRLYANVLKGGGVRVERPAARDIVLWHRGADGARTGHIGIVSRVDSGSLFWSIEGNKGLYPSKVREYPHECGEALLLGFCRLP